MMDNRGQLTVAAPPDQPMPLIFKLLIYGALPIAVPIIVSYKMLTDKSYRLTTTSLFSMVNDATKKSCAEEWYFQDVGLLQKLWSQASAAAYIQKSSAETNNDTSLLEYQVREGYCGSATQRCILKSLGYPSNVIPEQKNGESKPELWCEHVKQIAKESSLHDDNKGTQIETTILRGGDVTYEEFLSTIRQGLDNPNCRICCNYLRSALTGFELTGLWKFHPFFFVIKLYGGHFSPILGMVEQDVEEEKDNPFIAIFDTNHKYNGTYFIPCRRLYEAVASIDVGSKKSRAIILVEKKSA